jgi:CBS domain-containing protein
MFIERVLPEARTRLVTVASDALVTEVATLLAGEHDLVIVCGASGAMEGVISKTDLVRLLGQCHVDVCMMPASRAMTKNVVHCRPTDLLQAVWSLMKQRGLRHIPVIDRESRPVGVISARDALQALLTEVKDEEALLREYVTGGGYH